MISLAYAQTAANPQGSAAFSIIFMIAIVAIFYFLFFRPQSKRAKEHKAMVESLKKGDEVITSGGIAGKVIDIGDSFLLVEIASNTHIKVQKNAVSAHLPPGSIKAL